jgi:hypothetical protein
LLLEIYQKETQFPDMYTQAYTVQTKLMPFKGSEHITGKTVIE